MHGQYDWMGDPAMSSTQLRMGHRLPGRPVAPLAQLHAPHLHQHRRHGPRRRLRHPADERGPEVAPVLPGQPGLRVPADGAVPVRRRAARAGDRTHPRRARSRIADKREILEGIWRKTKRQTLKDYVAFPLLAGPFAPWVFAGNLTANLMRNVWSYMIIFCGHFPEDVQEFSIEETKAETRGAVVLPPDPRIGEPDRRQAVSHPERQPVVPDRAPPVPRHPGAPARRDRPGGARDLRALRHPLQHRVRCRSSSRPWCARSSSSRCPGTDVRPAPNLHSSRLQLALPLPECNSGTERQSSDVSRRREPMPTVCPRPVS